MTDRPAEVLPGVQPGTRVVVRNLIEQGERATDVLGELVARDATSLTVRTRAGEQVVDLADVVVAKVVPPTGAGGWRVASFLRRGRVAVLDLDGVLREHGDHPGRAEVEEQLGVSREEVVEIAFALPEATAMVTGGTTYLAWNTAFGARLEELGHPAEVARAVAAAWHDDMGAPIPETSALVEELDAAGIPVFVLTNGSDRVPHELETIGLGHLVARLVNTHDLGVAKPDPEAYAAAHAEIERRLGRTVGRGEVHFTDDRPENVDAAREFGWQARVFTRAPAGDG